MDFCRDYWRNDSRQGDDGLMIAGCRTFRTGSTTSIHAEGVDYECGRRHGSESSFFSCCFFALYTLLLLLRPNDAFLLSNFNAKYNTFQR
jgi:hypothetical protein